MRGREEEKLVYKCFMKVLLPGLWRRPEGLSGLLTEGKEAGVSLAWLLLSPLLVGV